MAKKLLYLNLPTFLMDQEKTLLKKVDVSALSNSASGNACTRATIEKMWWQCNGMKVKILV